MRNNMRSKRKMNVVSVWITVIFTVIAITLVALFIMVYSALLQDELHYTLRDQTAILADNADTQIISDMYSQTLQRLSIHDASTGYLSAFAQSEPPSTADLLAFTKYCSEVSAHLQHADRIEVYFPSQQMVVGSSGVRFLDDKKYASNTDIYSYLQDAYLSDNAWVRHAPDADKSDIYHLTFLRPYPGIYREGHQPVLLLSIQESRFHSLLRQSLRTLSSNDFVLIVNAEGVVLSAEDTALIGETLPSSSASLNTHTLSTGQKVLLTESASSACAWYYVLAHESASVLTNHLPIVSVWATLCVIMLVIGLTLVLFILMKQYAQPMHRLMQHFSLPETPENGRISTPSEHFLQMETALSDLNKARQDQADFLALNQTLLRNSWLNLFIRGEATYTAPQPHLDIDFPHPNFQAVIASPSPSKEMLSCILAALDPQHFVTAAFESPEKECVLLINHAYDESELPVRLESIAHKVDPSGTLVFGVGILAAGTDLVPASFRCARRALASRYFEKQQRVSVFDPQMPHTEAESALTHVLSQLTNLTNLIRRQSEEEVHQAIDSIIAQLKESNPYPNIMRSIMLLSAMFLTKVVYDMHGTPESVYGENLMDAYYRIEGISEFSSRLKRDSACLSAYLSQESSPGNRSVVQYAIHHIRNCPPSELFIQSIANALSISTGHLSRVFHQETGRKLVDYLQDVRMEHAARLLAEGQMSNEEICEFIGYSRLQYFSTKFKDHFGLTPNEYRRQSQLSSDS